MKIGFIGLGIMGSRMAANLLTNGADLIIHNRSKDKAAQLLKGGATWANSLADMQEVDILFSMLAHPQAVSSMALGPDGFLAHLRPGTLWIDCSTVNPSFTRDMAAEARKHNIDFLEAPVAGTKPQAQNAQLVFFVGGDADNLEKARPCFEKMGQRIVHVGDHGMGMSLKVVINTLLGTSMAAFAEAMALGEGLGLPQETLFNALLSGPVTAPYLASKRELMSSADYAPQFPLQWMHKDMQMAAVAAYESGVAAPVANATKELFQQTVNAGMGEQDFSVIYQFLSKAKLD
ncbi:MAG: NAD(P)-dependent oxidoreductase [Anaerolineae bacterium]